MKAKLIKKQNLKAHSHRIPLKLIKKKKLMLILFKVYLKCELPICLYTCLLLSTHTIVFGQLLLFSLLRSTFLHFCDISVSLSLSVSVSLSLSLSLSLPLHIHLFSIMFLSLTPCWESDTQTQTPSLLPTFVSFLLASDLLSGSRLPCSFSLCFSHTSSSRLFSSLSSPVFRSITLSLLLLLALLCSVLYLLLLSPPKSFSTLLSLVHPPSPLFCFLQNLSSPSTFIFFPLSFCVRPLREFALRMYFGVAQPLVIFQYVSSWVMVNVSLCAFFSSFVLKNDVLSL